MTHLIRLDKLLVKKFPKFSRAQIQKIIDKGLVFVNKKNILKSSTLVDEGVKIEMQNVIEDGVKVKKNLKSAKYPVELLYEDDECMVIDKPAGITVHPSRVDDQQLTVLDAVIQELSKDFKDRLRPGIVHRLDKETSGVLIVAKNPVAAKKIMNQFKSHKVHKVYSALVFGVLQHKEGIIDSPIVRSVRNRKKMSLAKDGAGRKALTKYKTLEIFRVDSKYQVSLLEIEIMTGRTHQIRVHMAALGHPVIGDKVYGNKSINHLFKRKFILSRQFLHALEIRFNTPDAKKQITVKSPLAPDLKSVLNGIA